MKPGPTGKFPRGKIDQHDEGEITVGMAVKDKTLLVNFGKPVVWFGLDLASAEDLAAMLDEHIRLLKEQVKRGRRVGKQTHA